MPLSTLVDTTSQDIGFKAQAALDLRKRIHEAGVQATKEVFEGQILPTAQAMSPVRTGRNRDSIRVSFRDKPETGYISAWIFTTSGYGWLIEHGTSSKKFRTLSQTRKKRRRGVEPPLDRTPPRPFLYPAVMKYVRTIAERARQILESSK